MDPYEPYWRLLELEPGADLGELKRAYREQAKTWHPDRFPYDATLRQGCEDRMRLINQAYEALTALLEGGAPPHPDAQGWRPAPEESEAAGDLSAWRPAPPPFVPSRPPGGIPAFASMGRLAAAMSAAGLALSVLFVLPNQTWAPYWTGMRLVAGPALAYAAAASFARGVWEMGLGLILLALALNPVIPVPMGLEEWRIFNGLTPPLLIGMFVWISKRGG
ncbi:MAG: J domain-containing protein [Elusimicrobia bacterium]|nr:J domain-containing protein [Elusimicrobiota bacterium]